MKIWIAFTLILLTFTGIAIGFSWNRNEFDVSTPESNLKQPPVPEMPVANHHKRPNPFSQISIKEALVLATASIGIGALLGLIAVGILMNRQGLTDEEFMLRNSPDTRHRVSANATGSQLVNTTSPHQRIVVKNK